MAAIDDFRKANPLPIRCPYCQKMLNDKDVNIDHIIPRSMGGDDSPENLQYVCKECNARKADMSDRLFRYYEQINDTLGDGHASKDILRKMAQSMSAESVKKKLDYIDTELGFQIEVNDKKVDSSERLKAYLDILDNSDEESEIEKTASVIKELAEAYEGYDFSNDYTVEIAGNRYTYDKDFPIMKYLEFFKKIGTESQGNNWTVSLDENGEVELKE